MNSIRKIIKFVNPASLLSEKWGWLKANQKDLVLLLGVFLISLISFAAGYLVAKDQLKGPIIIEEQGLP